MSRKGFLRLFIATPMDEQFGLWCFCSVNIPRLNCPTIFKSMCLGDISALRYSISGCWLAFNYLHLCLYNISILYVIICFFSGVGGSGVW